MRAAALLALLPLAACDRVFGLEDVHARDAALDTAADTPPGGDLIAWYPLDEVSAGTTLADASGHGNNATCVSCPAIVMGRQAMAAHFDGTSTIARVPSGQVQTPNGFTIALWMKLDQLPTDLRCMASLARGFAAADTWTLCIDDGMLAFTLDDGLAPRPIGFPAFSPGAWHHVAARWDRATAQIVVDGHVQASMDAPQSLLFEPGFLAIGGDLDNGAATLVFTGELDDVKLYSRALSVEEIGVLAQ